MKISVRERCAAGTTAVAALLLITGARGADTDVVGEFRRLARSVHADTEHLEAAWNETQKGRAGENAEKPPRLLCLALDGAVMGADLFVELSDGGESATGVAVCPGWSAAIHSVSVREMPQAGWAVPFRLQVVLNDDGAVPYGGKPVSLVFSLSLKRDGSLLQGTGTTSGNKASEPILPPARCKVRGMVVAPGIAAYPWKETVALRPDSQDAHVLHLLARWHSIRASRYYHWIRVRSAAAAADGSFGTAYPRVRTAVPVYPPLLRERTRLSSDELFKTPKKADGPPDDPGLDLDIGFGDEGVPTVAVPPTKKKGRKNSGRGAGRKSDNKQAAVKKDRRATRPEAGLGSLRAMTANLRRMRRAVDSCGTAPAAAPGREGGETTGDPLFGPWYGDRPLKTSPARSVIVPSIEQDAPYQRWAYVPHWQVLGPCPGDDWTVSTPGLPPVFDAPGVTCRVDGVVSAWAEKDGEDGTGRVGSGGSGSLYAATVLESETRQTVWIAFGTYLNGRLWLNGRRVASSVFGDRDDPREHVAMVQLPLREGSNRVLFHVYSGNKSAPSFWVRLCTHGSPNPVAGKARLKAIAKARESMDNVPERVHGFRNDGTASYPSARPVTAWDLTRNINVKWHIPLDWSHSQPVIAGNKLLVMVEPHFLVCLDKMTGKEAWRRELNVFELKATEYLDASRKLYAVHRRELTALRRRGAYREVRARAYREQGQAPEAALKRALSEAVKTGCLPKLEALFVKAGAPKMDHWDNPGDVDAGRFPPWIGRTFATPVTDGAYVWVRLGTGVTACYDMEGNRRWMIHTPCMAGRCALCMSPVLVQDADAPPGSGRLVLLAPAAPREGDEPWRMKLTALDAATGRPCWETPVPDIGGRCGPTGTPVIMRLSNGAEAMTVLLTSRGTVIRADDGRILISTLTGSAGNSTPTVVGDVLYRFQPTGRAERLLMLDRDRVGAQALWMVPSGSNKGGVAFSDGLLYTVGGAQHYGGWRVYSAVDGRRLPRSISPDMRLMPYTAQPYHPTTTAGGYAFFGSVGRRVPDKGAALASIAVMQTGPDGLAVATNTVWAKQVAPLVFDEDRIYLRGPDSLHCLARVGDKGRLYEVEVNARVILGDLLSRETADDAQWRRSAVRGRPYLKRLLTELPDSSLAEDARRVLARIPPVARE